jgi:hypothetical protein
MTSIVLTSTNASPQTWTPPSDCPPGTSLAIETWGAASGGSGGSTSFRSGGCGGNYASTTYAVTASDITNGITYTLQAGSAGTAAANSTAGPDTQFGSTPKNIIPNTSNVGAVVGTPGTLPTGWSFVTGGLASCRVSAIGVDATTGLPYIDLTFSGTTTSTSFGVAMGNNTSSNFLSPGWVPSTTFTSSGYIALISGALTNVTLINYQGGF